MVRREDGNGIEPKRFVGNGDRDSQVFTNAPVSARAARTFVSASLRKHGATASVIRDFQLVVGELAANAIEHGEGENVFVSVDFTDAHWWDVEVSGASNNADQLLRNPAQWSIADPNATSGRGLGITRALMDDVVTHTEAHWLSVRCRQRVSPVAET
jgi:anti-sigma regulatory factor (Ser/Thr protein kinase)